MVSLTDHSSSDHLKLQLSRCSHGHVIVIQVLGNHLHLWQLQHPVIMRLPFATFPTSKQNQWGRWQRSKVALANLPLFAHCTPFPGSLLLIHSLLLSASLYLHYTTASPTPTCLWPVPITYPFSLRGASAAFCLMTHTSWSYNGNRECLDCCCWTIWTLHFMTLLSDANPRPNCHHPWTTCNHLK